MSRRRAGGRQAFGEDAVSISDVVNVPELIDRQRLSGFQIRVAALCAAVIFFDGFDTQAIGYVAPAIIKAWRIPPPSLAPVFAAGLFGPLADRIGRKAVIVFCLGFFGLCSLVTPFCDSLSSLLAIRFVTGLGLGGAMPNAIALTSEYGPRRSRATMIMVMFCGFSLGSALGGLLAARLIPQFGWQAVFYAGGILPLAFAPVLIAALPESIRLLVLKGSESTRIAALLRRINATLVFAEGQRFAVVEEAAGGMPVRHLFREGRTAVTLLLWVMFFMNLLDLYFLANWLPTVIHGSGASLELAVIATAMLQVGGIAGTLTLGWVMDRFRATRVLALTYFGAGLFVAAIGAAGSAIAMIMVAVFGAGFCVVGAQIAANAFTAQCYPTYIRATGVGWALGIGRVGSIIGPVLGGMMLSFHWPTPTLFMAGAIPVFIAAMASFTLGIGSISPETERLRSTTA